MCAVAFASATLTIAFDAAEFAAIPSLVPSDDDLVAANGRVQASWSAAQIAGPLLAGLLVAVAPVQQVLWVDAASFLLSAGALLLIGRTFNAPRDTEPRRAIRQEVADGLRYVLGHPVLRNISAMMALINLVGATVYAQLVVFAKFQLEASDSRVALLYSAGSVGVVVLSLAAGRCGGGRSSVAALGALFLDGLLTVALAATSWYWVAVALWATISGSASSSTSTPAACASRSSPTTCWAGSASPACSPGRPSWSARWPAAGRWSRPAASRSSTASSAPWSPCWPRLPLGPLGHATATCAGRRSALVGGGRDEVDVAVLGQQVEVVAAVAEGHPRRWPRRPGPASWTSPGRGAADQVGHQLGSEEDGSAAW